MMCDRQVFDWRATDELGIPKIAVHEIMIPCLGMSKVCTRWVLEILTPPQHVNQVECCKELLYVSEAQLYLFTYWIVTGDESWVYQYNSLSQSEATVWKKPEERTPTQSRWHQSSRNFMLTILWDSDGNLLTDYLTQGNAMHGQYFASLIERLRSLILEKQRGKDSRGMVLLRDNAHTHKFNVAHAAIRQASFLGLNHSAYSPNIVPTGYKCSHFCSYSFVARVLAQKMMPYRLLRSI
jgi:[histone H3]-lysine36 N-dimethyltransferase SETMAR